MAEEKKQTTVAGKNRKTSTKYKRDRDREKVKGMFKFYELPGSSMSFVVQFYKEDPIERYDMVDGEVYEIPLGVAKHLNRSGWYPTYEYKTDEQGRPVMKIGQKNRRYGFQSLEFVDVEDVPTKISPIVTVENV